MQTSAKIKMQNKAQHEGKGKDKPRKPDYKAERKAKRGE